MEKTTGDLVKKIKALFNKDKLDLLLGFRTGPGPATSAPVFVRSANQAENLVFNTFCTANLARYLPDIFRRAAQKKQPRPRVGIVAKGCDARSVMGLVLEKQVPREAVTIIGVPCPGVIDHRKLARSVGHGIISCSVTGDMVTVQTKHGVKKLKLIDIIEESCCECAHPKFEAADVMIDGVPQKAGREKYKRQTEFAAKSIEERREIFQHEFSKCILCHACRQACPNCYCVTCFADQTKPRWVGPGHDLSDIMVYHLGRIFHQAGRCVGCDACVRACPQGVDLRLFTQKLAQDAEELYGFVPGITESEAPLLCAFQEDDAEEFITEAEG